MNSFKVFLGLTLLLTMVWLHDVLLSLISDHSFFMLLYMTLVFSFFAFFWKRMHPLEKRGKILFFGLPLFLLGNLLRFPLPTEGATAVKEKSPILSSLSSPTPAGAQAEDSQKSRHLPWEPWSEEKLEELKGRGETVFMDFTAKWCFTCKVNEKLVLETEGFKKLVEEKNLKILLADWTKRDPVIGSWLKARGVVGVPAYFIQKPNGEIVALGETISLKKIEENLP